MKNTNAARQVFFKFIYIFRVRVLIEEAVRIPFTTKTALAHARECELEGMVSDFTFETNVEGLLLGAAGPVGLRATNALPRMRFAPHVLLLSDSADEPGQSGVIKHNQTLKTEIFYYLQQMRILS